jgi:hypothetical protein
MHRQSNLIVDMVSDVAPNFCDATLRHCGGIPVKDSERKSHYEVRYCKVRYHTTEAHGSIGSDEYDLNVKYKVEGR